MKVSELISVLSSYDRDSNVIIYDDCSDSSYDISCIDTDENDNSDNSPTIVIFI